jgi:hypothetical protein
VSYWPLAVWLVLAGFVHTSSGLGALGPEAVGACVWAASFGATDQPCMATFSCVLLIRAGHRAGPW